MDKVIMKSFVFPYTMLLPGTLAIVSIEGIFQYTGNNASEL